MGKSNCSSSASSSRKSSYTLSITSVMRLSGRSTLLTTRMIGRWASSAFRSTNRVCGNGPSVASTSNSAPSTIVRPRSTSPPKSACPGVSTMLIFTSPYRTAAFLARIVIPFSRSRSVESRARSGSSNRESSWPDCRSMASTSVVLPWSTCAMIATLRRSPRNALRRLEAGFPLDRMVVNSSMHYLPAYSFLGFPCIHRNILTPADRPLRLEKLCFPLRRSGADGSRRRVRGGEGAERRGVAVGAVVAALQFVRDGRNRSRLRSVTGRAGLFAYSRVLHGQAGQPFGGMALEAGGARAWRVRDERGAVVNGRVADAAERFPAALVADRQRRHPVRRVAGGAP